MNSDHWEKVKGLFYATLDLDSQERVAMLEERCAGNNELRDEVESLLAADQQHSTLLGSPIVETVAAHMSDSMALQEQGLEIGSVLDGRYQIEGELGSGGMGVVYLASRKHMLDHKVVVKVLAGEHLQSTYIVQKFRQEMESLLRIDHAGIVRPLDAGHTPHGSPYLVMEYVKGPTLDEEIPPEGMALDRAAVIVRQLGEALNSAHDEKVFHRDVKPKNIMLCTSRSGEEQVKIIDFGIAKVKSSLVAPSTVYPLTVGTAAYMAPEQLEGKPVSSASDIYSLGVIAYQLITGRRPFNAETEYQLLELQRLGVRVRPTHLRHNLPVAAEEAVLKALSFKPQDRYQNAREFGEDFWRAINKEEEDAAASAPLRKPLRAWPTVLAIVMLTALIAGATVLWRLHSSRNPPAHFPVNELSYWIEVQKYRGGKSFGTPFRLAGEINFEKDYRVRLHLSSPQAGYLYIVNERPVIKDGMPAYNLLFPDPTINNGSAIIPREGAIQIPQENWFAFDEEEGVEKIWFIYSAQSVPEMEAVRGVLNSVDEGFIRDRKRALAIQRLISERATPVPEVKRDEEQRETRVLGKGAVLVHLIRLEHH